MAIKGTRILVLFAGAGLLSSATIAQAQQYDKSVDSVSNSFRLDGYPFANPRGTDRVHAKRYSRLTSLRFQEPEPSQTRGWTHDYREISDFFNVREGNVNTIAGEWELELEATWETNDGPGDDNFMFTPNIKYGLTEQTFVEIEVLPLNIGDGSDQGNGDFSLQWFHQFATETADLPAFAAWIEGRFPTGEGSSGVDGELHLNLTKTLLDQFRGHWEGFVETANGGRGDEDENRRSFQWGTGIGLDYQVDDKTIYTLNYLNRSSEERGQPNENILEVGGVHQIADDQHLKFALDIGLDGHEETPDFGVKFLWSIEW